jgi:hypothetical protein
VRKAARHCAWIWKSRPYRTAPHIKARFGQATLVNRYYQWLRDGKSPDCFALHYADRLAPVTPEDMRRFLGACGKAGTVALSQAAKLAGFERARYCRVRARLPRRLVRRVKEVFKERRKAELEARAAVKQFQWQMHLRLAADAARSRKLKRLAESFIGGRACSGVESTSGSAKAPVQGRNGPLQADYKGVARAAPFDRFLNPDDAAKAVEQAKWWLEAYREAARRQNQPEESTLT